MRKRWLWLVVALFLGSTGAARAESSHWAQLTVEDLRFARRLIADNHPAAVPERGDEAFQARLADYPRFETMAARVRTFGGYRAVMERFTAAFGDRHMARYPLLEPPARWPGFLVARRGDSWLVQSGYLDLPAGATLVSCDGRAPDAIAETNLAPYTPDWALRAQRSRASATLLVDRGDPFIERPRVCVFRLQDGAERGMTLSWQPVGPETLARALAAAQAETPIGNAIAPFADGWWLRMGTFQDEVRPTVEQFVAMRERLSGAPFVIVDVRGNVGGSSTYGDMVAAALYGSAAVQRAYQRIATGGDGMPVWRASAGNLELIEATISHFSEQLGPEHSTTRYFVRSAAAMREAMARGAPFSQAAPDAASESPVPTARNERLAPLRDPPRVYILTDFACFSACLETVQTLRALGAVQIGEDTDGGLNYFEVRGLVAPSGLSIVSTVQAYSRSRPRQLGPFTPAHRYTGDPSDQTRVETWVAEVTRASP